MHVIDEKVEKEALTSLRHQHLLGLSTFDADEINLILETARQFRSVLERPIRRVPTLRGITVVNLFFEPSTRTRISFELAEKRLSADTINFTASGSSVSKGETLKDTARNIEATKIDIVVIRHKSPGAAHFLTRCVESVVVNAGDGAHEHPTQALLDLLTISDTFPEIGGLNVSIIGDITHSRVARSNIHGLRALGANVTLCGPKTMMPVSIERMGVRVTHRLDEALEACDIAMALRIQTERQESGLFPSMREYHERYGIKLEHLENHPELRIMHPGPVNRGVELASEVVDHERAVILNQVTNGVAVRMAVLFLPDCRRAGVVNLRFESSAALMTGENIHPASPASLNLPPFDAIVRESESGRSIFDPIRQRYVRLTPEEWVRQHLLHFFVRSCGYPATLIAVEKGFHYQRMARRADVVVHDRTGSPFLLAECKAPEVAIVQNTFDQVSRYNRVVNARYLAVSNGRKHYCWHVDGATGRYVFLEEMPLMES